MSDKPPFLILLILVSFAAVGAVLFTPGLPSIAAFFNLSEGQAQLTITTYLVGYALGQLPYGPLANRWGRKITLYIGISLAIVGSLLCALSSSFESFGLLLVARFLQAFGGAVGLKITFTMIADVYNQIDATKMISRVGIAFAILPGLAVALGGWLTQILNWESCFYFLAIFGALVLWLCTKLPETAKSLDTHALNIASIAHGYVTQFQNQRLLICGLMWGCGSSVIYLFNSEAPFIGINLIGLTPKMFGMYNLIPVAGMLLGSILSFNLAGRFPPFALLLTGIIASLVATLTMLIPFGMGVVNTWSLFFPMFLIYLVESLVIANSASLALTNVKDKSNGSAVLNFINLGVTVMAVFFSQFIYEKSALLLPLSFIVAFSLLFFLWIRLKQLFFLDGR